jgi:hypothetical protein
MSTIRNIILGILPALSQHTVHILFQTSNPTTPVSQLYSAASLLISDGTNLDPVAAHPEQGGFRITTEALEGLPTWDCLYRFRYGCERLCDEMIE